MNATMKQMVAARSVGIMRVPNQPTYNRLLVDVTHSVKESQLETFCFEIVVDDMIVSLGKALQGCAKEYSSAP